MHIFTEALKQLEKMSNRNDTQTVQHDAASDQGLHCLHKLLEVKGQLTIV